ncbi:MAG TPA: protein UsfY [Mycobacterium sp.]|nr:protein UsfY [Mycobacterium sp.]
MKGAHHDPVDHSRTTQPHAGESFIDTLWLPGLGLIMLGTVTIAGFLAATAYNATQWQLPLGFIAGALVTAGAILIALEHHRVKRVEERWLADHRDPHPLAR